VQAICLLDGLYVPAGQAIQDEEEILPTVGLYVPAGQAVQNVCPLEGLYVPAGQAVQAVALLPDKLLKVPGEHFTHPKPFNKMTEPAMQCGQRDV
jgi:hypothetical protein